MRFLFFSSALTIDVLTAVNGVAATNCPCGYTVNATGAPFTDFLETDFLHVRNLSLQADVWTPQAYNVTSKNANGPFGKAAEVGNVITNPLESNWDWGGEGSSDPGLQFWVRKDLLGDGKGGQMVPMSELVSVRGDILYGTFRTGMKSTAVNGTCGAFFFYLNDTEEIDMEILSKQQRSSSNGSVNLVIQSPESAKQGYVSPGSPDFQSAGLPGFSASAGYHEYRFDWTPGRVDFYADSELLSSITDNVPDAAGRIHIVHWSNGNEGWSAGPPTQDAVLTVSYVKAYFNTTGAGGGRCASDEKSCLIPDQSTPPDPTGANGNVTGRTFFFSDPIENATASSSGIGSSPTKGAASRYNGVSATVGALPVVLISTLIFGRWLHTV